MRLNTWEAAFGIMLAWIGLAVLIVFVFFACWCRWMRRRDRRDRRPGYLPERVTRAYREPAQFIEGAHPSDRLAELERTYAMPTREPRR